VPCVLAYPRAPGPRPVQDQLVVVPGGGRRPLGDRHLQVAHPPLHPGGELLRRRRALLQRHRVGQVAAGGGDHVLEGAGPADQAAAHLGVDHLGPPGTAVHDPGRAGGEQPHRRGAVRAGPGPADGLDPAHAVHEQHTLPLGAPGRAGIDGSPAVGRRLQVEHRLHPGLPGLLVLGAGAVGRVPALDRPAHRLGRGHRPAPGRARPRPAAVTGPPAGRVGRRPAAVTGPPAGWRRCAGRG
jgi:hypothetical protein